MQNRHNVQDGSRDHTRLGLVGWISSAGIRNREKRVTDIVVRELKWGCIQAREVWSTEEEANMWTGHFWICKFGAVLGNMVMLPSLHRRSSSSRTSSTSGRSTRAPGTPTGTAPSSLNCGCIGLLMTCKDSRFRSGTPQRVLTTQVLRWQCSSTRANCAPRTSPSRK